MSIGASIGESIGFSISPSIGGDFDPIFRSDLQDTLVPQRAFGSPTPTFTRATTATVEDFEGLVKTVLSGEGRFKGARRVENLVVDSTDFTAGSWSNTNISITPSVSDPRGGTNASTLTADANDGFVFVDPTVKANATYQSVAYIRRRTGTGTITIRKPDNTGATDVSGSVTTSWKRFSLGTSGPAAGPKAFWIVLLGTSGDEIDVFIPQIEEVSGQTVQTPSEAVSSGDLSAPFHGANVDAVQYSKFKNGNTVSSNVVTEAQGALIGASDSHADASGPFGYRRELARINIALQNRTWEDVAWSATTMTVADNSEVGKDGRTRAATFTATAGNATIIQDLGVIVSAVKAWGLWIKRKTGTGNIDLTLDGGSTWTTKTITSEFTRIEITATLADPDIGLRIVTSADAVIVDYGQCEAAAFLSSTIPESTSSAVTRNADVLTFDDTGNILDVAGTAFASVSTDQATPSGQAVVMGRDTTSFPLFFVSSALVRVDDGPNQSISPAGTSMQNAPQKIASTWGAALTAYSPGTLLPDATPASYDGSIGTGDIGIGNRNDGAAQGFGTIRFVKIFSKELSASQVAGL